MTVEARIGGWPRLAGIRAALGRRCREFRKLTCGSRVRIGLDRPIPLNNAMAKRRELGTAAGRTSVLCRDNGLRKKLVERFDQ